ncbi:hypothetical protein ABZ621_30930 [Streptomyces sp. NPDC007863]|uniref:hypothetical protein n=1 Tax=Streptomyces sp. NPDC007863 TaxID=3154894 RepID=UPI0034003EA2
MNGWTAYGAMAVGAVMLGVHLADVLAIPYSIFAVLAGTALVVDGGRRVIELRRHRHPRGS